MLKKLTYTSGEKFGLNMELAGYETTRYHEQRGHGTG